MFPGASFRTGNHRVKASLALQGTEDANCILVK